MCARYRSLKSASSFAFDGSVAAIHGGGYLRALGQAASGHVDVADDHVRVEVTLPFLLQRFAEIVQGTIRDRGKLLLTKK